MIILSCGDSIKCLLVIIIEYTSRLRGWTSLEVEVLDGFPSQEPKKYALLHFSICSQVIPAHPLCFVPQTAKIILMVWVLCDLLPSNTNRCGRGSNTDCEHWVEESAP
jgi:hypothetical protein